MGLFALTHTVEIDVGDDFVVTLKELMDAGVQEDLDAYHTKLRRSHSGDEEFILHNSRITLVRLMIVSIRMPDGRIVPGPMSEEDARKMDRLAFAKLLNTVEDHNPPFNTVRVQAELETQGIDLGSMTPAELVEHLETPVETNPTPE